jgi:hypothetical protein
VLAMAVDAQAKAKEKANKTKCEARLTNIGSSGLDGVAKPASLLLPAIQKLLDAGQDEAALRLAERGAAQTRHRGHRTVLKLQQTVDQCVAKMTRDGDSKEDIAYVTGLGEKWIREVTLAAEFWADSFFDVF